jgi:NADH:ubiquinone oxidoreductase subunit K
MLLNQFLLLAAALFSIGVYGVLARRNAVLVLMSVELILNAVNINLVAFGAFNGTVSGEVFALFVIAIAAAEVAVGLGILVAIFRDRVSTDVDALAATGATVVRYEGADHGFVHDPTRPAHRADDAADAWSRVIDWLQA